jgi:hypothetical protein
MCASSSTSLPGSFISLPTQRVCFHVLLSPYISLSKARYTLLWKNCLHSPTFGLRSDNYKFCSTVVTIPVAAQSNAWVHSRSLSAIMGSNPAGAWMSFCCECRALSGKGLCVRLIARPEESY